jgi:hypothetical protein
VVLAQPREGVFTTYRPSKMLKLVGCSSLYQSIVPPPWPAR